MKKVMLLFVVLGTFLFSGCDDEIVDGNSNDEVELSAGFIMDIEIETTSNSATITIDKFALLDSEIKKATISTNGEADITGSYTDGIITFENLLSGKEYSLSIEYGLPTTDITQQYIGTFTTTALRKPFVGFIGVDSGRDFVSFSTSITDKDEVGHIAGIVLYDDQNNSIDTLTPDNKFIGLEPFSEYTLMLVYSYDLNDGKGVQYIEVETVVATSDPFVEYFLEVVMGSEFGGSSNYLKKWNEPMKLAVEGVAEQVVLDELDDIISDLNELFTDGFYIERVETTEESNAIVFFGTGNEYVERFGINQNYIDSNWGLFTYFNDNYYNIDRAIVWIDTERPNTLEQRSLLREELTQALGMANDSYEHENSVFYQRWTIHTEFAEIDKNLIYCLYHPDIDAGMTEEEIISILMEIVDEGLYTDK